MDVRRLSAPGMWLRAVSVVAVLVEALVAAGQAAASEPVDGLHPATGCVAPVEGAAKLPVYPEVALGRGDAGRVIVDLVFASPDARPTVRVVTPGTSQPVFEQAVIAHARDLRAPCLNPEDGPLRLQREFVFLPEVRQVSWFRNDPVDAAQEALRQCVVHASGDMRPEFPRSARRDNVSGRVLLEARFDAPDRPPRVTVHARPGKRDLERTVRFWGDGLRMPCHPGTGPIHFNVTFAFTFEGQSYGFRGLDLIQLMRATKGIRTQTLQFDTHSMQCPFEVRIHYLQPARPNRVGEIGASVDARKPLLAWLEGVELEAPPRVLDAAFGDSVRMLVPCVNIDLKPKE
jgi:hypothetical protein